MTFYSKLPVCLFRITCSPGSIKADETWSPLPPQHGGLLLPWLPELEILPWEDSGDLLNTSPAFATYVFPPAHTPPLGPARRPQPSRLLGRLQRKE